ncbi:MAG: SOS response-associated peptidase family protein [Sphingomonadaceae bacterium]|nr:SOS response-associated peptidase family protein [Sphingomonadaceae bacterium]
MCDRYRMTASQFDVARALNVALPFDEFPSLPPPELFPKMSAWVARAVDGRRILDVMSWGFPHLAKTPKTGKFVEKPVTNVCNLASPSWRMALGSPARRCLSPVTEFSEYGPGVPGKLPLHWFSIPSRPVFAFADVWQPLGDGADFAFLTCEPNPLVAEIHPKAMPVTLHEEDYDRWLICDYDSAIQLATSYPSQLMAVGRHIPSIGPGETEVEEVPETGLLDVIAD